jgi:hypothetical protein
MFSQQYFTMKKRNLAACPRKRHTRRALKGHSCHFFRKSIEALAFFSCNAFSGTRFVRGFRQE